MRSIPNEDIAAPPPVDYPPVEYPARQRNGSHPTPASRVPPHDLDAERSLLGACLLSVDAIDAATSAPIEPADFYKPQHGHVFSAIVDLRTADEPADPVTVADHLHRSGLLELVGGASVLSDLMTGTPAISNAARYAAVVGDMARLRRLIGAAASIADLAYSLPDDLDVAETYATTLLTPRPRTATESLFADAQAALDGEDIFVIPDLGPRDDGATCLLYRPGINWLSGEPGKGKTLLAQWWTHKELVRGNTVVYLDFEGTLQSLVSRLRQMGAVDVTRLRYVKHEGPWSPSELAQLRDTFKNEQPSLVVVDAVAGAMESEHLNPEDNQEVERWMASIPTFAHHYGAAVLCVDHVVKQADARGRYPIGAQRKLARADLAYSLRMIQDPGVGITGYGQLCVAKDRHGALAEHTVSSVVAEVGIVSAAQLDDTYLLGVALSAPAAGVAGEPKGNEPTWYMEKVSRALEDSRDPLTKTQLRALIGKHAKYVDQAIELLLMQRHIVEVDVPGKSRPYRSVVAYRQPVTFSPPPVDERYEKNDDDF